MEKALEAAKIYLDGALAQSLRRRYLHSLISVTAWNSVQEVVIWKGISKYSDHALWKKPYPWWNKVIEGHVRNRKTFMRGIFRAKENWLEVWKAVQNGDRATLVKLRIGLGYKGASVLLRDSGQMVIPLDTHVLQSEFGLSSQRARAIQSNSKEYIHYEKLFLEKYGDKAPLMDLAIFAREVGPERVMALASIAWRLK